jgi:superoxide dismutase, Cu-Zn family
MRTLSFTTALAALCLTGGLYLTGATARRPAQAQTTQNTAMAQLRNAAGDAVGLVTFTQVATKVSIRVTVQNLPPGFHGLHLHSIAACEAPFTSAGGHFNPTGQAHPQHAGDLPVLLVNGDGTGEISVVTDRFAVADLFDTDGTAVIIHAGPDNYGNIPHDRYDPDPDNSTTATGDAGGRLACGAVVRG